MRDGAATREQPPRQLFVVVERGGAAMRMRLAPSDRGERFAVVNGKLGIIAIEFLGAADRGSLTEVYHGFRNLDLRGDDPASRDRLLQAFSTWQAALAGAGITLRLEREALYGPPLPRRVWSPDTGGVSLRPWDIELTALEASLRRIVKLDQVPEPFVGALKEPCEKRGFQVEIVTAQNAGGGAATLLVSADGKALAEARDLERRLLVSGGDPSAGGAAARIGELLGYPPCCIERFQRVAEHNDTTLAWALLPATPEPASPFSQWLQPGLALLSHSPCDLTCAASIALARQLLDAVDAKDAGFAARWLSLAPRVQVVDHEGNRLALAVEGGPDSPQRIAALDLLSAGDSAVAAQPAALSGRQVVIDCGGLATLEGDWYAPYIADHRGPGGVRLAAASETD